MNHAVTSREAILAAAKELAVAEGVQSLSMRGVAARCGIAVGSVYNYFPTKAALAVAVVATVWQEIFHPLSCAGAGSDFLAAIDAFAAAGRAGVKAYPAFFSGHALIGDKALGREAMAETFAHMEQGLLRVLLQDARVRPGAFDGALTPQAFVSVVFSLLREDMMRGTNRSACLKELVRRALY